MARDLEDGLLAVADATSRLLAAVEPLPAERLPLSLCLGRALARDLRAAERLPGFASSAMDGYALRASELESAAPGLGVELRVAFEIAAGGDPPPPLPPGQTARIFTGAPIPEGADAVVMQERVQAGPGTAVFEGPCAAGEHVRPAGEDLGAGDLALPSGTTLGSAELGLAAALGAVTLEVHRMPRVAILTTGDELSEPGRPLPPGGLYDSNGPALAAAVREAGALVAHRAWAPDDRLAIEEALRRASGADLLLTVAGVSVGDRDLVRVALSNLGVTLEFWRVAMRPGKPVAFGRWNGTPVLGLPGNPVSAWVTFELFARPLLRRLGGHVGVGRFFVPAGLTSALEKPAHLALYCRGHFDDGHFTPAPKQGSGLLTSLARRDAIAELPTGIARLERGATVRVRLLGSPQAGTA